MTAKQYLERLSPWNNDYKKWEITPFLDAHKKYISVGDVLIIWNNPRTHTMAKIIAEEKYDGHYFACVKLKNGMFLTYTLEAFLEKWEAFISQKQK